MTANLLPFIRSVWPWKVLLILWVKNGRVMWSEPVVAMTNKSSPWSGVSWPLVVSACCWVRNIPVIDQEGLEKKGTNQFGVALWMLISVFLIWSLLKKGEKDSPGFTDIAVPHCLGPKRARRICKLFHLYKEDDVYHYVMRKPLSKEGKKPRTKVSKIEHLLFHISSYINIGIFLLRKSVLRKKQGGGWRIC